MLIPPVSVAQLNDEWSNDSPIDELSLDKELFKISSLHAKYLRVLSYHKLAVSKVLKEYNQRKAIKFQWYNGDLNNEDDLKHYKLEPMLKKILRQDIPIHLDGDEELNEILIKKVTHQEVVDTCTSIIKELNNRTWAIRSAIDWKKFSEGH